MKTLLLAVLFVLPVTGAQSVGGMVQDSSGAAIGAATVTVMDEDTGVRRTLETSTDGTYSLAGLPAGMYRVTVRRPGFQTLVRWNVRIERDTGITLDFVMVVGSTRNVITVEGAAPSMNVNDASVGTVVNRSAVDRLPVSGRGVLALAELVPGVVATPAANGEAGQFSTNGLRANTNYFTVDGVAANTGVAGGGLPAQFAGNALPAMTAYGSTQNLVTTEGLEEARVLTSSFAPEHGRLPGAQIALTTRAGTNQYHGSIFHALRNEALAANDWFANSSGIAVTPLRMNQWGASLGGPVRRDRTFIFASYEGLRLLQPVTRTLLTPSAATRANAPPDARAILDAFPAPFGTPAGNGLSIGTVQYSRPSRLDAETLRIDHALSDRITLFGRINRAPSSTESGFAQIEHSRLDSTSVTVGMTFAASAGTTNDLRTNVWATSATSTWSANPAAGGQPLDLASALRRVPGASPAFFGVAIGGVGALYSGNSGRNHQTQWNLLDTLAIRREKHDVRLGIDYQRLTPTRETAAESVSGRWDSLSDLILNKPSVVMNVRAEQASALVETLSVFAQDTWSVTPRLNITYGARWEITPAPAMRETSPAFSISPPGGSIGGPVVSYIPTVAPEDQLWKARYTQVAPRIGAAFRAGRSSVIRAGWGVFYDVAFATALDPINGYPFNRWQFSSGTSVAAGNDGAAFGLRYAADLKLPYTRQWNFAYERMLGLSNVISVSAVGSAGRRLLRYEGAPIVPSGEAQYLIATNRGSSDYRALEFQYRRRFARGLEGMAAYTWSHSIDNGSSDSGVYVVTPDPSGDRGSSSFDVRHNFTAALTWVSPYASKWLAAWQVSTILRARTGFPIDVLTTENLLGLGFDDYRRPDLIPGVPLWLPDAGIGGRRLNPAAFATPAGAQGNLGRNAIGGAGMSQVDLALERRFAILTGPSLDLRLEAYNVLNHPNPADPVRYLDNPLFGTPVSMLNLMLGNGSARSGLTPAFQTGGARTIQVQLRFRF